MSTGPADWPRARTTAALLREQLAALGIPDEELRQMIPCGDLGGGEKVRLGVLSVKSADLLLAALSGRGPAFIGRPDGAPALPGAPE